MATPSRRSGAPLRLADLHYDSHAAEVIGDHADNIDDGPTGLPPGFVLRRFERFTGAEARTWWVNGICRLVGAHPDTPATQPPTGVDLSAVAPLVKDSKSRRPRCR